MRCRRVRFYSFLFCAVAVHSVCRSQSQNCARASTPAFALRCVSDLMPATTAPLTSGTPYVSVTDPARLPYAAWLYPQDANQMPLAHRIQGEAVAATIRPLDANGSVDPANGKILAIAEGMSNTRDEMNAFLNLLARRQAEINPKFQLLNFAEGECDLECWLAKGPGAVDAQVQIALLKHSNNRPQLPDGSPRQPSPAFPDRESKRFPGHAQTTKEHLKQRILVLKKKYPNLKMVYLTSRTFGGWSCAPAGNDFREPVAFEEGFAVKWLVADQILRRDPELEFEGDDAPAPWLAWGPYLWDSTWRQDMYRADGTHPCETGADSVAQLWWDFLMNESTARAWFVKNGSTAAASPAQRGGRSQLMQNFPNPFNAQTEIVFSQPVAGTVTLAIYDLQGRLVRKLLHAPLAAGEHKVKWDGAGLHGTAVRSGIYLCKLESAQTAVVLRVLCLK